MGWTGMDGMVLAARKDYPNVRARCGPDLPPTCQKNNKVLHRQSHFDQDVDQGPVDDTKCLSPIEAYLAAPPCTDFANGGKPQWHTNKERQTQ